MWCAITFPAYARKMQTAADSKNILFDHYYATTFSAKNCTHQTNGASNCVCNSMRGNIPRLRA
jgi:hypothetical protein